MSERLSDEELIIHARAQAHFGTCDLQLAELLDRLASRLSESLATAERVGEATTLLRDFARQKTTDEWAAEDMDLSADGDIEGAYDTFISKSRQFLASHPQDLT